MKIFFLITDLGIGGAQQQLYCLLQQLDREKWHPSVFSVMGLGVYASLMSELGVPTNCLCDKNAGIWNGGIANWVRRKIRNPALTSTAGSDTINASSGWGILMVQIRDFFILTVALFRFAMILRRFGPAVVHCYGHRANLLGSICKILHRGMKLVCTELDLHLEELPQSSVWRGLIRYSYQKIDDLILVCRYMQDGVQDYLGPNTRIHLVYVYVGLPDRNRAIESETSDRPLTFGVISRLTRAKGVDVYVEAVSSLIAEHLDVRFILAGDGNGVFLDSILERCESLSNTGRFLLVIDRKPLFSQIINQTDVYVNPSLTEAMNVGNIQALAHSKPVIATRVGGTAEVISHQNNGLLIPPNDVAALSRAMAWMVANRELCRTMGIRGKQVVRSRFSGQRFVRAHESVYA